MRSGGWGVRWSQRAAVVAAVALGLLVWATSVRAADAAGNISAGQAIKTPAELPARSAIQTALEKPIACEFVETPLAEVVHHFEEHLGIDVRIDRASLKREGVPTDAPVTASLQDISAAAALRLILHEFGLAYVERDGVLMIAPYREAEQNLVTRVFNVADLVYLSDEKQKEPRYPVLINLITSIVSPTCWDEVGGVGSIAPLSPPGRRLLIVSQSQPAHEQIAELLTAVRAMRHSPDDGAPGTEAPTAPHSETGGAADSPPAVARWGSSTAPSRPHRPIVLGLSKRELALRQGLKMPIAIEVAKMPLADVVNLLRTKVGKSIHIDRRALAELGVDVAIPITFHARQMPLGSALSLMLREVGLTWRIREEVILITTPEEAESQRSIVIYDVADLLDRLDSVDFDVLVDAITRCIAPTTWDAVGGPASIGAFEAKEIRTLVISQTDRVHADIERLLADLRAVPQDPDLFRRKQMPRDWAPQFNDMPAAFYDPPPMPDPKQEPPDGENAAGIK